MEALLVEGRKAVRDIGATVDEVAIAVDGAAGALLRGIDELRLGSGINPSAVPVLAPRVGAGKILARFNIGDAVHVWSNSTQRWIEDGVVREVLAKDVFRDGRQVLTAGSTRVVFNGGSGMKWVASQHIREVLRCANTKAQPSGVQAAALRRVPTPQRVSATPAASDVLDLDIVSMVDKLQTIEEAGIPFTDPEFRATCGGRISGWCRPQEVTCQAGQPHVGWTWELFGVRPQTDWQLFHGSPQANDVKQGELGDCWLISSLANLADFQDGSFIRALLPGQETASKVGAYLVRLCLGGRWRGILVDDRLPHIGGGLGYHTQLAFCETDRLQLWASVVEKAFAKVCGGYANLHCGEGREALSILTGWPCDFIDFNRRGFEPGILWATLSSSKERGFLVTCGTREVSTPSLSPYHIYSLLDVFEVTKNNASVQLVKIRNPQIKKKWEGAWSDNSSLWTPELRQKVGCPVGGTPGVFFMCLVDFLNHFASCTICKIKSMEWHENRASLELCCGEAPLHGLSFQVQEVTECSFSLVQPEARLRKGPLYADLAHHQEAQIGFVLLRTGPQGATVDATAHLRCKSAVSLDCWLQPGQAYLLVPFGFHRSQRPLPATLACFSSRPVVLQDQRVGIQAVNAARGALAPHVSSRDQRGGVAAPCAQQ